MTTAHPSKDAIQLRFRQRISHAISDFLEDAIYFYPSEYPQDNEIENARRESFEYAVTHLETEANQMRSHGSYVA